MLEYLLNNGFVIEFDKPTLYVKNDVISFNFYKELRHPNDKGTLKNRQSQDYNVLSWKIGDSKGRMIGLEQSNWIGIRHKLPAEDKQ